jgi:tagatose 1,6-diphosphate aldolase
MALRALTREKREHLVRLSTPAGVIAALAIDQRKSLRMMIAGASGRPLEDISDDNLADFKSEVVSALTPYASAVLIDPEYGAPAFAKRAAGCGLLTTYESDGYENPRPYRMLALMPDMSVRRLAEAGAEGTKILLSWAPDDEPAANEQKQVMIERIGYECDAAGLPFFLEPVVYDPRGAGPSSIEYIRRKADLVVRTIAEFSKPDYRVDVLKVEFPVNASAVAASVYSRDQALDWYRRADAAASIPYIFLSAGVTSAEFLASLNLASEAGVRYSGVLCGRATWSGGVRDYALGGREALARWLSETGVRNIRAINDCLQAATPWTAWFETSASKATINV